MTNRCSNLLDFTRKCVSVLLPLIVALAVGGCAKLQSARKSEGTSSEIRMVTIEEDAETTRRIMEEILAKEEEHADDLNSMLQDMGMGLRQAGATG